MKRFYLLIFILGLIPVATFAQGKSKPKVSEVYYPGKEWKTVGASDVGMNQTKINEAIGLAIQSESKTPKNLEESHYQSFGREPFGDGIGPFKERGGASGIIVRNGYIVAQWGDVHRTDMTFSVTKSFLSSVVGVAYDRGLIPDIHDSVYKYVAPVYEAKQTDANNKADRFGQPQVISPFETPHNRTITIHGSYWTVRWCSQ